MFHLNRTRQRWALRRALTRALPHVSPRVELSCRHRRRFCKGSCLETCCSIWSAFVRSLLEENGNEGHSKGRMCLVKHEADRSEKREKKNRGQTLVPRLSLPGVIERERETWTLYTHMTRSTHHWWIAWREGRRKVITHIFLSFTTYRSLRCSSFALREDAEWTISHSTVMCPERRRVHFVHRQWFERVGPCDWRRLTTDRQRKWNNE